jgi:hypothetical protein
MWLNPTFKEIAMARKSNKPSSSDFGVNPDKKNKYNQPERNVFIDEALRGVIRFSINKIIDWLSTHIGHNDLLD